MTNDARDDIYLIASDDCVCNVCIHNIEDAGDKNSVCWDCTRGACKFNGVGTTSNTYTDDSPTWKYGIEI